MKHESRKGTTWEEEGNQWKGAKKSNGGMVEIHHTYNMMRPIDFIIQQLYANIENVIFLK